MRAIDVALQKVATSYMRAEKGSAIGGMKTDLPAPQPYKSAPDAPSTDTISDIAQANANLAVDLGLMQLLTSAMAATSAVSGAAAVIEAVNLAVIVTNVRLPMPFFTAGGHLNDVSKAVNGAKGNLNDHVKQFGESWQGKAPADFQDFMSKFTDNKIPQLATVAENLSDAANGIGSGIVSFFFELLAANITALTLLAAEAAAAAASSETIVGPAIALGAQWVTVGIWLGAVFAILNALWNMFTAFKGPLTTAGHAATTLAGVFFSETDKLEDSQVTPSPTLTDTINWNKNWQKKK